VTPLSDYPPPADWPALGVLADPGFTAHDAPPSRALADRVLAVHLDRGGSVELRFDRDGVAVGGPVTGGAVREAAPGLLLLHGSTGPAAPSSWTAVLDLRTGLATTVTSTLGTRDGRPFVEQDVDHGVLDGSSTGDRHHRSSDLVGRRVLYVYGPGNAYEHLYLNDTAFTWHCLAGPEAGLADTDRARVWALREQTYLLAWQEGVVPCDGIVVVDLERHRSTGRIWGLDTTTGAPATVSMSARETTLGVVQPDPALWRV
jgi:hypothetical protein